MGLDIFFEKHTEVAYFRKVNFLVAYMSAYFDEDIENLKDYYLDEDCVEELIQRCKEVLFDHSTAPILLPTTSGFFFGNTEYNRLYFEAVQEVMDKMNDILQRLQKGETIVFRIWY